MSVFKFYKVPPPFPNYDARYDSEFQGLTIAGEVYKNYWQAGQGHADDVFFNFIWDLVANVNSTAQPSPPLPLPQPLTVTYKDDAFVVHAYSPGGGGARQLRYDSGGGHYRQIHLKGFWDDAANDTVDMVVPNVNVDPTALPYLDDAVRIIADPRYLFADKKAYLLGLLLTKRCR